MMELAGILRKEAEGLVEAGIDIIQIDDPALTYFCDPRLKHTCTAVTVCTRE